MATNYTKEQAAARMKMIAAAKAKNENTDTWWGKLKNEAYDMGQGLVAAAKDPLGTVATGVDVAAGGVEAGTRYIAPDLAKHIDELNNYLANATGNTIVEPKEVGVNSPAANVAAQIGSDMHNSFRHPINSIQERPLGTMLDWTALVTGGVGKIPGIVRKAGELKTADEILAASKAAKDEAFAGAYAHPGPVDVGSVRDAALRAAEENGYNPSRGRYAPNKPAVDEITSAYQGEGTARDIHDMRIAADKTGIDTSIKNPSMGPDNHLAAAMKQAIDSKLEETNPEVYALLKKAFDANTKYRNTQAILDVEAAGRRAGAVTPNTAKAVGREVNKLLGDKEATRGLGEEGVRDVKGITDMLGPATGKETLYASAVKSLPTAMGALGFATPLGPAGALAGFAGGGLLKHVLTAAKDSRTAKMMSDELRALAQEINDIPRGKGKLGVGMMSVTPKTAIGAGAGAGILPHLGKR